MPISLVLDTLHGRVRKELGVLEAHISHSTDSSLFKREKRRGKERGRESGMKKGRERSGSREREGKREKRSEGERGREMWGEKGSVAEGEHGPFSVDWEDLAS